MNLHQIKSPDGKHVRFAGSMTDATHVRKALSDETGIGKLSITIAPVEVPTDKPGLIAFLNGLAAAKVP